MSGADSLALKYDATAPAVTGGHAARGPDAGGWYNRAVPIAFSGTDATSGVDACTDVTYGGPDSATATVPGTCTRQGRQRQRARSSSASSTTRRDRS